MRSWQFTPGTSSIQPIHHSPRRLTIAVCSNSTPWHILSEQGRPVDHRRRIPICQSTRGGQAARRANGAARIMKQTAVRFSSARALALLRVGVGDSRARFRAGQEEAIRHVFEGSGRLLVVQKTGWGKSFVYFVATKLLREAGMGPALLVSPLLALMRNQIAAAERNGRASGDHQFRQSGALA